MTVDSCSWNSNRSVGSGPIGSRLGCYGEFFWVIETDPKYLIPHGQASWRTRLATLNGHLRILSRQHSSSNNSSTRHDYARRRYSADLIAPRQLQSSRFSA